MANKRYYCKYRRGAKMWHVVCAPTIAAATKIFIAGTRYTSAEVTVQAKKPRTNLTIAGINTTKC